MTATLLLVWPPTATRSPAALTWKVRGYQAWALVASSQATSPVSASIAYVASESCPDPNVSSARFAAYRKLPLTWTSAALEPAGGVVLFGFRWWVLVH